MPEDFDRTIVTIREVASERHDREQQKRWHDREERSEDEHPHLRPCRLEILLEEELDAIGEGLQNAERAGGVGSHAVLEVTDHLALEPDHQHRGNKHEGEHDHDLEDHDQHDREVDVTSEERISAQRGGTGGDGCGDHFVVSIRSSVTRSLMFTRLLTW